MTSDASTGSNARARRLPPRPTSVGEARALVRDLLVAANRDDLVEPALLLVSEVVTNAVLHAGTPIEVSATVDAAGLRVEVADGSEHHPARRHYATTAGTGRGVMLLDQMVDEWGVLPLAEGKTVWFRLSGEGRGSAGSPQGPRSAGAGGLVGSIAVELHNMPLLLHGAWQEQAETLLRELLLARLDEGDDPIRMHAEATDAIAVLEEHVPSTAEPTHPDRLMADATEPRVSAEIVEIPVPRGSVPHFVTLDRAIEEALELAAAGRVMTPPTQPEVRAFRRWLCAQVREQAAGGAPVPWTMRLGPPPDLEPPRGWDATTTTGSAVPRIAIDEANRIIAVSASILRLLGYDEPGQLVGQRLVEVIPHRFRQAHIAGFTLFLLVGRDPLIGTTVVVPALRRDGTEVDVELTVTVQPAGDGRSVFVAEMLPA